MADPTFRDFAGAVMAGKPDDAARVLEILLGLDPAGAAAATAHFQAQMQAGGPAFMGKAMGLRQAVASPDDVALAALLGECFGLGGGARDGAVAALRARYPA